MIALFLSNISAKYYKNPRHSVYYAHVVVRNDVIMSFNRQTFNFTNVLICMRIDDLGESLLLNVAMRMSLRTLRLNLGLTPRCDKNRTIVITGA